VLSAAEARLLDRLAFAPRGLAAAAGSPTLHHANVRGHGLEFHDFRAYQPGDDPRTIDWTVHARLRQMVVRTTRAEAQLRLHLLIDTSLSMSIGTPSKLAFANKLAAALACIAARRRESLGVATFDRRVRTFVTPTTGRGQLLRVLSTLQQNVSADRSSLNEALSAYGSMVRGPGLVVIVSDFFDPAGTLDGLRFLLHRGLRPALLRVAADEECDPGLADELELIDVEQPMAPAIVVNSDAIAAYRARLTRWFDSIEAFCRSEGIPWIPLRTSLSLEASLTACRRAQLIVNQV
jgi:uncharacterized protein (DUF58 family)